MTTSTIKTASASDEAGVIGLLMIGLVERTAPDAIKGDIYGVFEEMGKYHPTEERSGPGSPAGQCGTPAQHLGWGAIPATPGMPRVSKFVCV